jgi:integrase
MYLYGCAESQTDPSWSPRRAVIATLGLAGLRIGELCQLDNRDINLSHAQLHIGNAKTAAGVRTLDIHPRLLDELGAYRAGQADLRDEAPAFLTRWGTRRSRSNVLTHVIRPAVARANQLRRQRGEPPIRAHVTPHTFRRSYISFMVAAGYDLPYIQAQVGHRDPSTTLAIYAQVIARPDRDQLRAEIRQLLGVEPAPQARPRGRNPRRQLELFDLRTASEKAAKGRALHL